MAGVFSRKSAAAVPEPSKARRSLTAAASPVDVAELHDPSWHFYRFRDESWQRELWRLYDIIGEFRFYANWVGSHLSRARIYVAKLDRLGRLGPEVEDDKRVAALADTLFGDPGAKAEALRLIGIDLSVAGECYVLGQEVKNAEKDEWFVLTPTELKRYDNGLWWGDRRDLKEIVAGRDLLSRIWTPHPRRVFQADCSARAVMPVLRELEQLTKYVFAQIDSRLFGAGLLPIPTGMNFPDGQDNVESAADSLLMQLAEAGQASMRGQGTAAGVLPVIAEFPPDTIDKIKLVSFASELSKQALDLRAEAIRRLGLGLDMAPETLKGMGESTTHWSSWMISANEVNTHIVPLLARTCAALTKTYLQPALKIMGKDPDRYCYWHDTSPLTTRPQRLTDALNLHKDGLLGDKAVREAGFFLEHEAPTEEESAKRFLRELMLRDPTLFAIPAAREIIGIKAEMLPPESVAPPPPPPVPDTGIQSDQPAALPGEDEMAPPVLPGSRQQVGRKPAVSLAASGGADIAVRTVDPLLVASEQIVLRALELAGKRLLTRGNRGQFTETPQHELHTKLQVADAQHAARLMAGAWDHVGALVSRLDPDFDGAELQRMLAGYCTILLTRSQPHRPELLEELLRRARMMEAAQ